MTTLRITAGIIDEVICRELSNRASDPKEPRSMEVYLRIEAARSTRKDGSVSIEVSDPELQELYSEADFSSDPTMVEDPSAGYLKSWAALKRQIDKTR